MSQQQQVIVPLPAQQPKKATATVFGLDTPTLFWILLGLHGAIIAAEVYLAWRQGWIKW